MVTAMALSEPVDFLADWPGWITSFEPMHRQEQSRVAGGRTYVRDMGQPLWRMTAQSKTLTPNQLDHWRAKLNALGNGLGTFIGYKLSRCYPILYPNGSWPTGGAFSGATAAVHTIGGNNKSLRVKQLPVGYIFNVGDMIRIGAADLYEVMETAAADGAGITPLIEVRPHFWPGTVVDAVVSVKRPHCIMALVPGSVSADADLSGRGSISFQPVEAR
jgi:hypothetical protein